MTPRPAPVLAVLLLAIPLAGCLEPNAPPPDDPTPDPAGEGAPTMTPATTATPATPATPTARSPYAGNETRAIKALSPQQVEDLLAGKGMGYALAAELNSYPGPAHALELADALELTAEQREAIERVRQAMQADAVALGERLVAAERALDEAFANRTIDRASLARLVEEAARLEGDLRFVHLDAHLDTTALLTPAQVARYDHLRGYSGDAPADGGGHGDGQHAHGGH